jgi:hypothetical protein
MEHPHYSPDLAPSNFWFIPKTKSALKGQRFHDTEVSKKQKSDEGTQSYATTGIPKIFPTVTVSLS